MIRKFVFLVMVCVSCQMQDEMADVSEDGFLQEVRLMEAPLEVLDASGDTFETTNDTEQQVNPPTPEVDLPNHAQHQKSKHWCTTEPMPESLANRPNSEPSVPYRPNFFVENHLAPPKPSNLQGGPITLQDPDPAMAPLLRDYKARGCDDVAMIDEHRCKLHPYRQALEREYENPEALFQKAREHYADEAAANAAEIGFPSQ